MKRLVIFLALLSLLVVSAVSAQDAQSTAEPTIDHAAHHPVGAATAEVSEATVQPEAPVQAISGSLDAMMKMDMPADMMKLMQQMKVMVGMMQGLSPQGRQATMMGMMGMMMGMMQMDMPADTMQHMKDMMATMHPGGMMDKGMMDMMGMMMGMMQMDMSADTMQHMKDMMATMHPGGMMDMMTMMQGMMGTGGPGGMMSQPAATETPTGK